jgi:hypothetical protein
MSWATSATTWPPPPSTARSPSTPWCTHAPRPILRQLGASCGGGRHRRQHSAEQHSSAQKVKDHVQRRVTIVKVWDIHALRELTPAPSILSRCWLCACQPGPVVFANAFGVTPEESGAECSARGDVPTPAIVRGENGAKCICAGASVTWWRRIMFRSWYWFLQEQFPHGSTIGTCSSATRDVPT